MNEKQKSSYITMLDETRGKIKSLDEALNFLIMHPKDNVSILIMGFEVNILSVLAKEILEHELHEALYDEYYLIKVLELADEDYNLLY